MRSLERQPDAVGKLVGCWLGSFLVFLVAFELSVTRHVDLHLWWGTLLSLTTGAALLACFGFFLAALAWAQPRQPGTVLAGGSDGVLIQLDRVSHPFRLFVGGTCLGLVVALAFVVLLPHVPMLLDDTTAVRLMVALLVAPPLATLHRGRRLRIDRRGIHLGRCQSLLWDRLAYLELRSATYDSSRQTLVLERRGGPTVEVQLPPELGQDLVELIVPRLPRPVRPHRLAPWLARAGRELPAWTAALGRLLEAPEGYREINLRSADLVDALVDTRAPLEQRIGAALGLRAAGQCGCDKLLTRAAEGLPAGSLSRRALLDARDGVLELGELETAALEERLEPLL